MKAAFSTTKFCTNFLEGKDCLNSSCLFLHEHLPKEQLLIKSKSEETPNRPSKESLVLEVLEKSSSSVLRDRLNLVRKDKDHLKGLEEAIQLLEG